MAVALLAASGCFAASEAAEKRGWWWYVDPPSAETVAEAPERQPLPPLPPTETLMGLHPDEFRPLMEAYKKESIWRPTVENVGAYYRLEDVARRRAAGWAAVKHLVMLQNPALAVSAQYPITGAGTRARTRQQQDDLAGVLSGARDEFGLVFLVQAGCPYCKAQRPILGRLASRFGWQVAEVDVAERPEAAERFGVETTPTILLVRRGDNRFLPVAIGVEDQPTLAQNLYRGIRLMRGEIRPEQFFTLDTEAGGPFDPLAAP